MAVSRRIGDDAQPIADINTTPLVDVMLVLLIMFILIIPVGTHKVPLDRPVPRPGEPPQTHRLDLDAAGRLFWDGRPVAAPELTRRLRALAADPARPALEINADAETRYDRFDEVLAAVRRAGVTRMGFVGQHRFAGAI
ncbi:MAG: biopolymer transport protein ExbD [Sphingomonadales bacterium]|nr:biopolymer transport protein ExbD [Sphingomonadales bacterium]